jgi:UDP-2,3-diacylglucosamine pyrophosphatase LpxH
MIDLGSDKPTISKLDNIELREITRSTISNLNTRNQNLRLGQTLRKNKLEQEVNQNERHKDKISSQSSVTHKGCLHLRCGAHKEPGLFQP